MTTPPRPPGRPTLPPERARSALVQVRVSQAQAAKFEALGGAQWLRRAIDRARS